MSQPYLIPLSGIPETFSIILGGTGYTLTVQWRNDPGGPGLGNIITDQFGNPLLDQNGDPLRDTSDTGAAAANPGWFLDIGDANNDPIVQGIPLITGADLLEQYGYLDIGGALYVQTAQDPGATPTYTNLGTDANLYWVPDA